MTHLVHTLEHGRVEIQYKPTISPRRLAQLGGLYNEDKAYTVLFPNAKMPYAVAVTAWGHLAGCKKVTDETFDVIRAFKQRYLGAAPEPLESQATTSRKPPICSSRRVVGVREGACVGRRSTDVPTLEADVAVVGAGPRRNRRRPRGGARRRLGRGARGPRARRRAARVDRDRRWQVGRRRRTVDRPDAGSRRGARPLARRARPSRRTPPARTSSSIGGRLIRYTGTIPRLGPHVLADVGQAMLRLDRMASKVPLEAPWEAPRRQRNGTARRPGRGCGATWRRGPVARCWSSP